MPRDQRRIQNSSRRAHGLADYLRAARRRKLLLFVPPLILSIASALALSKLPKLYESFAALAMTSNEGQSDFPNRLSELRQQITSREVLESLVSNQAPNEPPNEISQIRNRLVLKADAAREQGAFSISYRATDPETAQKIVKALVDRILAVNAKLRVPADSEVEGLRKRAADISVELHRLEQRDPRLLTGFVEVPVGSASQSSRSSQPSLDSILAQQMTIESLKDQQYKFQQELADIERRIGSQRQIVEQQEKVSALRDNPTYAVLIARRTELQGQRDTLINRQELTDKHPRVLAINDQIAAINRQIDELRKQDSAVASQSPEARELASLESEQHRLRIELEVTGRELVRRSSNAATQPAPEAQPRRDAAAPKLMQEYIVLKRSYQQLASDLQSAEARLSRTDGADLGQLRVIEPPNLPERPVSLSSSVLIAIAAAAGLVLGAVLVSLAESRRFNSLEDPRDVEYYTRLPLLASIPTTTTVSERRRAWWRGKAKLTAVAAASVVATFALTKIFVLADILALITKK